MLKKLNLLRVPPEVELDGLDTAEYEPDIHVPEFGWAEDLVIEPDGTRVPAAIQAEALTRGNPVRAAEPDRERGGGQMPAIIDSAPDCISATAAGRRAARRLRRLHRRRPVAETAPGS